MTKHSFLKHSRALSSAGLQWGVRAAYLLLLLAILYLSLRGSPSAGSMLAARMAECLGGSARRAAHRRAVLCRRVVVPVAADS